MVNSDEITVTEMWEFKVKWLKVKVWQSWTNSKEEKKMYKESYKIYKDVCS